MYEQDLRGLIPWKIAYKEHMVGGNLPYEVEGAHGHAIWAEEGAHPWGDS